MRKLNALGFALTLAASGCASSTGSLQQATAMSIGGNVLPDNVVVSNVDRGMTRVTWSASASGHRYACSADDMVRRPYCARL